MSSTDERIVSMRFDNAQFQKGITQTTSSLEELKKGLDLKGATDSLNGLGEAGKKFSLDGIASGIDNISSKFSAFGAIGFSVIQSLTNSAMNFGKGILSSILDPLIQGGEQRALTIEQAKFQFEGLGMDIEATMASAKDAVLGTAYSLADAAKAASIFGASGMRAGPEMTSSLRAVAGVAAMTGASYEDISNIFTAVAGNGRMMGTELLQFSYRGLNAAAVLGEALHKPEAEIRQMVTAGDISFKIFSDAMDQAFGAHATDANKTYTGSLANMHAALSRIGAAFATPHFENQRRIFNALTPVIDNVKKALLPLVDAFTSMSAISTDKVVAMIQGIDLKPLIMALPFLVKGFQNLLDVATAVMAPIKAAFKDVFHPNTFDYLGDFAAKFQDFTAKIKIGVTTTENLKRTFAGVFAAFDIGVRIVKEIFVMFGNLFGSVSTGSGSILNFTGNIGDFIVKVDNAIKSGTTLKDYFTAFGAVLATPILFIKSFITLLGSLFDNVKGLDLSGFDGVGDRLSKSFAPLVKAGSILSDVWDKTKKVITLAWQKIKPILDTMADGFKRLGTTIGDALKTMDPDTVLHAINTGLFAGGLIIIKTFLNRFSGLFSGSSKFTFINSIKLTFTSLTNSLKVMQSELKAKTLLEIAGAIALLALSVIGLSLIDQSKLTTVIPTILLLMTSLMGSLYAFTIISTPAEVLKMMALAAAMISFSVAIDIITLSVMALSKLSWEELAKGLLGVTVLMGVLVTAAELLDDNTSGLVLAGAGLKLIASAIAVLAKVVKELAKLSWEELAKGISAITLMLAALVAGVSLMDATLPGSAALVVAAAALAILQPVLKKFSDMSWEEIAKGLVMLAGAITILAVGLTLMDATIPGSAGLLIAAGALWVLQPILKKFSEMSWEEIGKAMTVLAGSIIILAAGLTLMDATIPGSAGLLIAAAALVVLQPVLEKFSGMSWEEIAKGLVALTGALLILAGGLTLMDATLPGSAALFVASEALAVLGPVLVSLGGMSWADIGKGLAIIAGVFLVLAIGGEALGPVVGTFVVFGLAMLLVGVGTLAAGVGILAFSAGLVAITGVGFAATLMIGNFVNTIIELLPKAMEALGNGIVAFAKIISDNGPTFVASIVTLITSLATAINTTSPTVANMIMNLIQLLLNELDNHLPDFQAKGLDIINKLLDGLVDNMQGITDKAMLVVTKFLDGIGDHIEEVVAKGLYIVTKFIDGIASGLPDLINSAGNLALSFVNDVSDWITNNQSKTDTAGTKLAHAIIDGVANAMSDLGSIANYAATKLANGMFDAAMKAIGAKSPSKKFYQLGEFATQGLVLGLNETAVNVNNAATNIGVDALSALKASMANVSSAITANIDAQPTIKPVLDLSDVKSGAGLISSLLTTSSIAVGTSYNAASSIAVDTRTAQQVATETTPVATTPVTNSLTFVQNNTSPTALSSADIYRQTKNQLSVVKGALVS